MEHEELRRHLAGRLGFWESERIGALEARKREELEFHNLDRGKGKELEDRRASLGLHENRKWYWITEPSQHFVKDWIARSSPGRSVLDYACGLGGTALFAAKSGAAVSVGLDISDESVRLGRSSAADLGLSDRAVFVQGDCEDTEFPSESFDVIICQGMLHHLDLDRAYAELRRILRPGGRILCVEALGHNPLIQAYRNRTPHMRTEFEAQHILRVQDMARARKWFRVTDVRYWHLCDLAAVPLRRFVVGEWLRRAGRAADSVILSIPLLQRMAWQFTFVLQHPKRDSCLS